MRTDLIELYTRLRAHRSAMDAEAHRCHDARILTGAGEASELEEEARHYEELVRHLDAAATQTRCAVDALDNRQRTLARRAGEGPGLKPGKPDLGVVPLDAPPQSR